MLKSPQPGARRGIIARLLVVAGIGLALLTPLPAAALTDQEKDQVRNFSSSADVKRFFGGDPTNYVTLPPNPENAKAKDMRVVVCKQGVECREDGPGALTFKLEKMVHHDRRGDEPDTWDFIFRPVVDGKMLDTSLKFVYKKNPGQDNHWGLVYGEAGDGTDLERKVGGIPDFEGSDLAGVLRDKADGGGTDWAEESGVSVDTQKTSGDPDDPFAKAVTKMAEAVGDLNASVGKALLRVVDLENISEIRGLSDAWKVVRDLVNLLFVVVLAALSIMTIARIDPKNYNVRRLLPLLVFADIAVNFSLLFATIIVNTATVLSQPFADGAIGLIENTGDVASGMGDGVSSVGFGEAIVLLLASFVMLIGLVVLLFFFIIRIIVVWLVAVLSPVILLFMVAPLLQGEAKNLLATFVRWVYMAPIAFLILFIAAQVLAPPADTSNDDSTGAATTQTDAAADGRPSLLASDGQDDPGANAILRAIFYAGVLIAAVMLPMALGRGLMQQAARRGMQAGALAGKGGFKGAAILPAGQGRSLGQRVREGKAFMEQRKGNLERRASLTAANAQIRLADGPMGASITGMDEGIRTSVQDKLLADKEKEMLPYDISAKRRIAHAWQYGTDTDAGGVYARDNAGDNAGYLSRAEQTLSQDRIAAGASYKALAQSDMSELYMVRQPGREGRTFAWTGGQQLHRGDPVIGSFDLDGRLNEYSMQQKAFHLDADGVKGLDTSFINRARGGDRHALTALREVDEMRLAHAVDREHRDKFTNTTKMAHMYDIAQRQLLSRSVNRGEYATGAAYNEAVQAQQRKEELIRNSYRRGEQDLARRRPHDERGS